jgi:tRNA G10  N-methylase Trm11
MQQIDKSFKSGHCATKSKLTNSDEALREAIEAFTRANSFAWTAPANDKREHIHALFQYPAMMVPSVQENLINLLVTAQPAIETIFDPFVGAGTVMTAGLCNGLSSFGQDINPLAVLLSSVKTGPFFGDAIKNRIEQVISSATSDKDTTIDVDFPNLNKWFQKEVAIELSRLRRAIIADKQVWARRFFWVTLAETIRLVSNDRTTTYKLHARPTEEIAQRNPSAITLFVDLARRHLMDLQSFKELLDNRGYLSRGRYVKNFKIVSGDTTKIIDFDYPQSFDLVMTSPPYGDNSTTITYGQHAYLPLQWIELKDIDPNMDASCLRTTQEIDRRSLGGKKSRQLELQVEQVRSYSSDLSRVFDQLKDAPRDRTSRVAAFFEDFEKALQNITSVLNNNGYVVWTIGNRHVGGVEIPNDKILTEMLEQLNVELVTSLTRDIHGKRMPHRNGISKMMSQEKILIFRKNE